MALIQQDKGSLYGGVSGQSPAFRRDNQVEEMVNCLPTVNNGTRLRNPSYPIHFFDIDGMKTAPTFPDGLDTVFVYEYDKGNKEGLSTESYAFLITDKGGLEIADMNLNIDFTMRADAQPVFSGTLYRDGQGVRYEKDTDRDYITAFGGKNSYAMVTVKDVTFVANKSIDVKRLPAVGQKGHKKRGYLWIKRSEPTTGWKYGCTLKIRKVDGTIDTVNAAYTDPMPLDTIAIATEVANNLLAEIDDGRFTVTQQGSKIMIELTVAGEELVEVRARDSFGDTASFGWTFYVDYYTQLPEGMGGFTPVVRVGKNKHEWYWLLYSEGKWKEWYNPEAPFEIDPSTMPRVIEKETITRGGRVLTEYVVKEYDWNERLTGDGYSNAYPSFIDKPIKDIFFFRNRLGFITDSSISLSEAGYYGNFFRTSVAALLDQDRIDAGVESLKAINLEYALLLDDSIVLISDRAQFRFSGGDILSPASHQVTQVSAYDVDIAVRPIMQDNRIFFVVNRGANSAVYEMHLANSATQNTDAVDVTIQCPDYVSGKIDRLSGSSAHKMIFAASHFDFFEREDPNDPVKLLRNTVYVYNYYNDGNDKLQSAWHKWTWKGDIYSGFALGTNFYTMLKRDYAITPVVWILSTGEWRMNKLWLYEGLWIMEPASLERQNQIEIIPLDPFDEYNMFLDNYDTKIDGYIGLGEWMYGSDGKRTPGATLQFRTMNIEMSDDSSMGVLIKDTRNGNLRYVKDKLIKQGRRIRVGGNAKNVRIGLTNSDNGQGFRLDVVTFEGTVTKRARSI